MRILTLALLTLTAGCVTADEIETHPDKETHSVPSESDGADRIGKLVSNSLEGAWNGEIVRIGATELPFEDDHIPTEIMLLNCDDPLEIWTKTEGSSFSPFSGEYEVISKLGNHLISTIRNGDGWVETQSWGLISVNNNRAYVQWNRMVSNPFAEEDDESRFFGQFGFGELERFSMDCDVWKKKSADDSEE